MALGLPPEPRDAELDLWDRQEALPEGTVHLELGDDGADDDDPLRAASDALARLVLAGFEGTLPTWTAVTDKGFVTTRKSRSPRRQALRAMPLFLLEVNWADAGPGFSWPEAYHLGWLPGFERWVVTGSSDSSEVDGYCDRVVGSFGRCADPILQARKRIQASWRVQKREYKLGPWERVLRSGRIRAAEAKAMARAVWRGAIDRDRLDDED